MKQEPVPDPEAELKRTAEDLRAISAAPDATETPALELVHWALRVYAYCILSQLVVTATMHPLPQVALSPAGY